MKKIRFAFLAFLLISLIAVMFSVTASAEETITVTYHWYDGSVWETAKPNDDGSYTLRGTKKSSDLEKYTFEPGIYILPSSSNQP